MGNCLPLRSICGKRGPAAVELDEREGLLHEDSDYGVEESAPRLLTSSEIQSLVSRPNESAFSLHDDTEELEEEAFAASIHAAMSQPPPPAPVASSQESSPTPVVRDDIISPPKSRVIDLPPPIQLDALILEDENPSVDQMEAFWEQQEHERQQPPSQQEQQQTEDRPKELSPKQPPAQQDLHAVAEFTTPEAKAFEENLILTEY